MTSANIAPVKLAWDHQTALIIPNGPHYGQELSTSGLLVIREWLRSILTSRLLITNRGELTLDYFLVSDDPAATPVKVLHGI